MSSLRNLPARILHALFGRWQWQPPAWIQALQGFHARHPRLLLSLLVLALASVPALMAFKAWLDSRPQPAVTTINVQAPGLTRVGEDDQLYPDSITLRFTTHYPDPTRPGPRQAAKLEMMEQQLDGIILSPAHPGSWRWQDQDTLVFDTSQDWPASTTYTVTLPPDLFADGINLEDNRVEFSTPDFVTSISKLEFYRDPQVPGRQQTVATLNFSHAVDLDSLKKHAHFGMRPSNAPITVSPTRYPYNVELGRAGREAYLTSEPLTLPQEENFMTLTVEAGVSALLGNSQSRHDVEQNVRIPSVTTFFRVRSLDARIIRNEDDQPEQTLVLELTDAVRTAQLAEQLQAWVMPENFRQTGKNHYSEQEIRQFTPLALTGNPSEHEYSALQTFRFRAPENRALLVRLPAGLTSQGQFVMSVPYEKTLWAPGYPREVNIVGDGGLLALKGDQKLGFQTRGVQGLDVEITQLYEEQIAHLVSQTSGAMQNAQFQNWNFSELNIGRQQKQKIWIAETDPAKAAWASLDLAPLLDNLAARKGLFVIQAYGTNAQGHRSGPSDRRLLLVSDMALLSKRQADNQHHVYVMSLSSQQPLADAQVSLVGRNGDTLLNRVTDASGHVAFPNVSDYRNDREPVAWLVRRGNDLAFMPYSRNDHRINYSRFDTGGIHTGGNRGDSTLRAMVISDRGIYRPGESGHLAVISKRDDWQALPDSPIEITVTDPRGKILRKQRQRLADDGLQELAFELDNSAATGHYNVTVELITNERHDYRRQIGQGRFSVEEFQPDTLRIHSTLQSDHPAGWHTSAQVAANISLQNLFGLPAQDRRVTASYTLAPTQFRFEKFDKYVFSNPYRDVDDRLRRSVTETLPEQRSDDEGNARFDIDLSVYGKGLYRLVLDSQGYDSGDGRSVSARSSVLVSPLTTLVGSRSDGDLTYIRRDSERNLRFIAIDPSLQSVATDDLTLRVSEIRHLSTLVKQRDGTLAYQTIDKREQVNESPFRIAVDGSDWQVPSDKPGDFVVELVNQEGLVMTSQAFSVIGSRNLAANLEKNAELEVKLDRSDYKAGDQIEMQITAPYKGAGLITIERDKVFAHKWFTADSQRTVQTIRVPAGLEANAYINVTFVRSLDDEDIFTQPMSVAVVPFNVDRRLRTIDLVLDAPAKVQPGDTLPIRVTASQPGKLVVYAVNEGILQVANYQTPRPLDLFLQKRALEVSTQQIADMLLPEFSLLQQQAAAGGGAMRKDALGSNLNPFQRGVKAPVVFWSGILDAGTTAQTINFTVPDYFDGELRIMALASNDQAAGATDQRTTVRGPFVLSPNVITAVAPGDEFDVSVGVANALPAEQGNQQVTVSAVAGDNLELVGDTRSSLTLKPGAEGRASFRVRAGQDFTATDIVFRAETDAHRIQRTATLSVRPPVPHRTTLQAGIGEGKIDFAPARRISDVLGKQNLSAGFSPIILADGLQLYLNDYPHACSEQIISRVFPVLGLLADPASRIDRPTVLRDFNSVTGTLSARQLANGAFGFWPGSQYSDDTISVYAMHFLLEAQQQQLPVADSVMQRGLDFLRQIAAQPANNNHQPETIAYAIYVLTRSGLVTTNYLTQLQESLEARAPDNWKSSQAAMWMAASYQQLKLDKLASELIRSYTFANPTQQYQWDLDSALLRNAQYLYVLGKHFPARLQDIDDQQLMQVVAPVTRGQFNTLSAAWSVMALSAWGEQAADAQPATLALLAGVKADALTALAQTQPGATRIDAAVPFDSTQVALRTDAAQRVFFSLAQAGYDTRLPDKVVTQGLEITRRFLDENGNEVASATQGSTLTVQLRMRALDGLSQNNVAVIDLLPGGFEVLRDSVRDRAQTWHADYVDIREDRLVLYGTVSDQVKTFEYQVKLTGRGEFVVPPPFAESMYHLDVQAQGLPGRFHVTAP